MAISSFLVFPAGGPKADLVPLSGERVVLSVRALRWCSLVSSWDEVGVPAAAATLATVDQYAE
ncbi:hypothetical protein GCM10023215_11980 [Pseudonocardia yuanmonensis]|uniref:Uncharacterized protein n=1 Tax=Pseudonocardia yuanmonensis TaxID=1095914 RepID=A0ABP8W691_9PSEU